jgi:hypothetical protein
LSHDCWQVDPAFQVVQIPIQRTEIPNDVYGRQEYDYEYDPYDAEVVSEEEEMAQVGQPTYDLEVVSEEEEREKEQIRYPKYDPFSSHNERRGFISTATIKRRDRLGLETIVPTFVGVKNQPDNSETRNNMQKSILKPTNNGSGIFNQIDRLPNVKLKNKMTEMEIYHRGMLNIFNLYIEKVS